MARHLLIDGDVLVYRHAHAEQQVVKWDSSLHMMWAELKPAVVKIRNYLTELQEKLEADSVSVVLSDVDNSFRRDLLPEYKAARVGGVRPVIYQPLRDFFMDDYNAIVEPRLEGDDLLGLYATSPAYQGEGVICTIDKDLGTVPGFHFNLAQSDARVYSIDQTEADYNFLIQTLMGDRTDGYPGCPGIGPKRAEKILEGMARAREPLGYGWARVLEAYEKAGLSYEFALANARCARILRGDEYNFKTKEIKLWEPPRS